ncbi:MAG: hypothetical protein IJD04_07185, partial [Desulfovibrionaceae bacterium]|nr:hypothetical protein [Desulfovibrionaceae bacterium]
MIVVIFSGLVSIYVIIRLIWPMGRTLRSRLAASFALLLVSQYHSIIRSFSGTLASPEVPAQLIMFCGWLYGAFLLAASLCLLKDVGIFISFVLRKAGLTAGSPLKNRAVLYIIGLASLFLS